MDSGRDAAMRESQDAHRSAEAAHRQAVMDAAKRRDDAIAQAQDWSRRAAALELEMADEQRVLAGLHLSRSHEEQQQVRDHRVRAACLPVPVPVPVTHASFIPANVPICC